MSTKLFKFASTLSLSALLPALCAAEVDLYGKANVSLQHTDDGDDSYIELVSNASRIGLKGSETLENGIEAFYKFEFEVQVDDGDKSGETFAQRNIYVGLKGDFGSVQAGKFDTPLKVAQKKVDLFNDLAGDIKNMITVNDIRADNSVAYTSPDGPFVGSVAFIAKEEDGVDDGISASFAYSMDNLYLAVAMDQDVAAMETSAYRFVAQYNMGDFQFGLLGEEFEGVDGESDSGFMGSVQYKLDKWALKAQVGQSDIDQEGGQSVSVGADYKLAGNIKAFGYFTDISADDSAEDDTSVGVGMEYKF